MATHTVSIDQIKNTVVTEVIASSTGNSHKHLKVLVSLATGAITYEVNDALTDELERAVWLYNALP